MRFICRCPGSFIEEEMVRKSPEGVEVVSWLERVVL